MIDLERLLDTPSNVELYNTHLEELTAVARREKAISIAAFSTRLAFHRDSYDEYVAYAKRCGLDVRENQTRGPHEGVVVASGYPEHLWRFDAYRIIMDALFSYGWSDSSSFALSIVLGYSRESARKFIEHSFHVNSTYGAIDVMFVVDSSQYVCLLRLNGRLIPDDIVGSMATVVSFKMKVVSATADKMIPQGHTLCRFAVAIEAAQAAFGWSRGDDILTKEMSPAELHVLSLDARSNIQLFRDGQWRPVRQDALEAVNE